MKKKRIIMVALLCCMCMSGVQEVMAASPAGLPEGGKRISDKLIGIFFEDISSSADGGLFADLIQNGSFEYSPAEHEGWSSTTSWKQVNYGHATGYIEPRMDNPICDSNPKYIRIMAERVKPLSDYNGWLGVGLQNTGHDGINVKAGASYDLSLWMRSAKPATVRVVLIGKDQQVLAETELTVASADWKQYTHTFTPNADCADAQLAVLLMQEGTLDVDMVSLMPQDTYKGHGLRRDMMEALEALHPKFVRFPGGCIVHGGGDGMWNSYRWKTTIGPREQRRQLKNAWGYHQSMGLGYQEYFQLCEDLGAEPLPILSVGVSCQGAGHTWGVPEQGQTVVPMSEMDEWVNDALDLIEWANGDASTTWGRKRIEDGHPAPFHLKYLGLGNEERITPEFEERFEYVYNKVREKYPDIIIIGTVGPWAQPGNGDYESGWRLADRLGVDLMDEHYYALRDFFFDHQANYDGYSRTRKSKVYLGEYAAKDKKIIDALAEAIYLTNVERNGDVVSMTSYAPLFAKRGHENWAPNLIYFDNQRLYPTCSYYVQQMFGATAGQYYYDNVVSFAKEDKFLGASCVLNTERRELYIKLVNATEQEQQATIDLSRFKVKLAGATIETLKGDTPDAENNYDQQPIAPETMPIKLKKKSKIALQPLSFSVVRVRL